MDRPSDPASNGETLLSLASAIRRGELSAVEALDVHAARVAQLNPTLNAVVSTDLDAAYELAERADAALARGESWGPLHGVPFALKDCHEVSGFRTTAGSTWFADYQPRADGAVMQRLRAAGAILFARTNVAELLADFQCANPLHGRTSNPFDVQRTSGGSTGGAAAVASGMSPFDVGTDLAGSIRLPAAFCGVYGIKPTEHRISASGAFPNPQGHPRQVRVLSCIGPLARTVDDLAFLLSVLSGPTPQDLEVAPVSLTEPETIKGLRIAVVRSLDGGPIGSGIERAVRHAASALRDSGAMVEEVPSPAQALEADMKAHGELVRMMLSAFQSQSHADSGGSFEDYLRALARREQCSGTLEHFFSKWDVLLCPVAMTAAFRHCEPGTPIDVDGIAQPYDRIASHLAWFNYTGHPALSVPVGSDAEGLPLAAQLVAGRWQEGRLLTCARVLRAVAKGQRRSG